MTNIFPYSILAKELGGQLGKNEEELMRTHIGSVPLGAVVILPIAPQGIVCIYEPGRNREVFVKFPSGGIEQGETPAQAAARELMQETGICEPPEAFKLIESDPRPAQGSRFAHMRHFLKVLLRDLQGLRPYGTEGEVTVVIQPEELFEISNSEFKERHGKYFLRDHLRKARAFKREGSIAFPR